MTYHSKGEPFDEVIYFLAREIFKGKDEPTEKYNSWEECFLNHAGCTLKEYIEYAKENKLKEKYIDGRSSKDRANGVRVVRTKEGN